MGAGSYQLHFPYHNGVACRNESGQVRLTSESHRDRRSNGGLTLQGSCGPAPGGPMRRGQPESASGSTGGGLFRE